MMEIGGNTQPLCPHPIMGYYFKGIKMTRLSGPKIVFVGGGSYGWCPRLMSDLMQTPGMEGSEIVLLDPNITAAEEVAAAGRTMAAAFGREFSIHPTQDEAEAFRDTDFVLITISTGGLDMMEHDLTIPEKYGIFQTVGDTVGPGGWSRTLRNVPVFLHLAQQIERYAPRAVVLNYTNPLATLTGVLARSSSLRVVGLCHGVFSNYHLLQTLFDVSEQALCVCFGGVNHFFWILDFTVGGEPGYPLLKQRLGERSLDEALNEGTTDEMGFHSNHTLCNELYQEYGYLPYVGDRHTSEFLSGYLTPSLDSLTPYNLKRTPVQQRREGLVHARQRTGDLAEGKESPPARSRETAIDIMMAFITNTPFVDVVNLPNTGQIDNLPRGAVVETLGHVDSLGFRPITTGALPTVIESLMTPHCTCQMMTLDAALTGDRDLALQALMLDPLCSHLSPSRIRQMGLELIEATRAWLPQL